MSSFRNHRVIVASLFLPTTAVLGETPPATPEKHVHAPTVSISAAAAVAASTASVNHVDKNKLNSPSVASPMPRRPSYSGHSRHPSAAGQGLAVGSTLGPLKSIVEDLKDKSRQITPTARSPSAEIANPFAKILRFSADVAVGSMNKTVEKINDVTGMIGDSITSSPGAGRGASPEEGACSPPTSRKHTTTHTDHQHPAPRVKRKQSRSSSRRDHSDNSGLTRSPTLTNGHGHRPNGVNGREHAWHFEQNTHCNGGLKNAVLSVTPDRVKRLLWVGTLGTNTDNFCETLRKDIDKNMMQQRSSLPVWIPDAEFASYYDEFCHQVLWPCLHYAVPDAPKTKLFYESASWKQYVAVNKRFAKAIMENVQEGDIIWVNDYHLMLLPALIRTHPKYSSSNPIGFFMHVAFPSSEIFRCLSVRDQLLNGMLGADLVGFQTASFARHFRQTVSRILAYEALPKGIQIVADTEGYTHELDDLKNCKGKGDAGMGTAGMGRFVDVGAFPMGIDVRGLKEKKTECDFDEWVSVLKQRYSGMKILVGRDKLDEVQGVKHKLLAFEMFLDKYREFQEKVVLIQVALQTTETNEFHSGVADIVSRINSKYSTLTYQPVIFLHTQDLTFNQYLALLTVADAFIVTSLREGMALRTHEYVECQEGSCHPLILSEFTGSYSYSGFRSCIAVNPWDTRGTASAIHRAITMTPQEMRTRWEDLHNHVTTQTAQAFITSFLTRCVRAHTEHLLHDLSDVPVFDLVLVLPRWKHSNRRLVLVDFEGTLWKRDLSKEGLMKVMSGDAELPEDALNALSRLAENKHNEVWLLSGLQVKNVLDRVAERVPKLGIVGENGCFIKPRPNGRKDSEWISMVSNLDMTWKGACLEILHYFTERTPGAFVEEREASVVWRYWTGGPDDGSGRQWARRQAAEAQNHIFDSLGERYGLRIIPGKNSFLVLPNHISRSTAVGAILHPTGPARSPLLGPRGAWLSTDVDDATSIGEGLDLLIAISSDEKLLRRLNEFDNSETCSTSGKGTDAKWKLDAADAKNVLEMFASVL
ncbi:glycosyltransferase family 20 protein [Amanita thiersii Skay4041]|uniref:Glycosyltransferase family 20 protein n=1 Tax=Amanita thiersii Skay4041 TaxID=703135 RepID=A0A2A9NDY3_9AGAR|nr:glycosyltransferase family 20 protein [Amanita thiersii Skay4041]